MNSPVIYISSSDSCSTCNELLIYKGCVLQWSPKGDNQLANFKTFHNHHKCFTRNIY